MTEKQLLAYRGKTLRVTSNDDITISGFCCICTQAIDNTPEIASITLETSRGLVEILEPEIKSIEVIE